ncbi:MAG TPA: alpha/beta hydrolase [Myxococcaceae bacterium]|jgi:pimeloyl-ACP methyl ester carboxylesterase
MSTPAARSFLRRWARRILLGVLGLIALILAAGSVYERMGRRRAARDFPPPGQMVNIGGRRIQLDCRGTGSPIVVFESGLDLYGSLSWSLVHDEIAKTTRACAYSRAGLMWSDPPPGPQNGMTVAEDLHATLEKAGEQPPYVLVAHSLGGPYAMTYTKRHAPEVAGLVFVDATHPDQFQQLKAVMPNARPPLGVMKAVGALSWTGLLRALMAIQPRVPGVPRPPPEIFRVAAAFAPISFDGSLEEMKALDATLAEAGTFHRLGDRPLVVLTAMAPLPEVVLAVNKMTRNQADEMQARWRALHEEEASWSSRGQHQLVDDATHYIQFDRPDVVIAAVRTVIQSVRDTGSASGVR